MGRVRRGAWILGWNRICSHGNRVSHGPAATEVLNDLRFCRHPVIYIQDSTDRVGYFAKYKVPNLLFVSEDRLVIICFKAVEVIHLGLKDGQHFAERVQV